MRSLYISQQGCYVSLQQDLLIVKQKDQVIAEVQLPLLEQILVFGKSQVTTGVIRACLWQNIPIVYLSRMGFCYGRIMSIERGYRQLSRYQQQLTLIDRLMVARNIVRSKLHNSKVILQRQNRRSSNDVFSLTIKSLNYLIDLVQKCDRIDQLLGYEGAGANSYFSAFGMCLNNPDFVFMARSRRPPLNPVNAMLSFGYQVLWNHLLALIEVQDLDPYSGCLHEGSYRHAALVSDLVEEFRAPIVDSLVLYLVNRNMINSEDFVFENGGCFLNDSGRRKFLNAFLLRMEEVIDTGDDEKQPRWDLLMRQVKLFKRFVYNPVEVYQPFLIR